MATTYSEGNGPDGPHVVYWAAARAAAGVHREPCAAGPLADVLATIRTAHPRVVPLLDRCLLVLDGVRVQQGDDVEVTGVLELLPPFAGGSR